MQIDLQEPLIIDSILKVEPVIMGMHSSLRLEGTQTK